VLGLASQIARGVGTAQAEFGTVDDYGRQIEAPEPPAPADELNRNFATPQATQFGVSPLIFTSPLPVSVAQSMYGAKMDEIARADASARQAPGIGGTAANFAVGLLDPVGAAASLLPVVGEARMAGLLARAGLDLGEGFAGRSVVRAATGAATGGAVQLPLVGTRYALSRQEQADYSMSDAMADIVMGSVTGGGLHAAIGGAGDMLGQVFGRSRAAGIVESDPVAREDAMRSAVASVSEDRPLDIASVVALHNERENLRVTRMLLDREREGVPDYTPPAPGDDVQARLDQIDEELTRPDTATTQDRLDAIDDELTRPGGLPAARQDALLQERRMLTEGSSLTPDDEARARAARVADLTAERDRLTAGDPTTAELENARSDAERVGLQAASDRITQRMAEIEDQLRSSDAAKRAQGAPAPDDAVASRQALDAAQALPKAPAPPPPTEQIATLEDFMQRTRDAGRLAPDHEAALGDIQNAQQASEGYGRAIMQAASCLMQGLG
jgi:hypothetical protein